VTSRPEARRIPSKAGATNRARRGPFGTITWFGVGLYVATGVLLLAVVVARLVWNVPVGDLTRDPATVAGTAPFVGWLSNVGILGLCAAASICLFTWAVLRDRESCSGARRFLRCAGLFTSLVLIDDLFMLHDAVLPDYLGIGEAPLYCAYAIGLGSLLILFRREILSSRYGILVVALFFFGVSIFFELISRHTWVTGHFLLEDGSKLIGIMSWALYFGTFAHDSLRDE
jgi:hypothetical protein